MNKPFKPGDRVVHTGWNSTYEGVGGTVMEVSMMPHPSGTFAGVAYYLLVILDTAEEILDEAAIFQHEVDYDPRIPF